MDRLIIPDAKKTAKTIWIVGTGTSIDLFDFDQISKNDIIITTNAAIRLIEPDFQIGGDMPAINEYLPDLGNATWVCTNPKNTPFLPHEQSIPLDKIIPHRNTGSGGGAFSLAYYLYKTLGTVKKVGYVGIDFARMALKSAPHRFYLHGNRLEGKIFSEQAKDVAPENWHENEWLLEYAQIRYYHFQVKHILKQFQASFRFKAACVSHSHINLVTLKLSQPRYGFDKAQKTYFSEPKKRKTYTKKLNFDRKSVVEPVLIDTPITDLWIIGSGPSLSVFKNEMVNRSKSLIITINSAICAVPDPDYQVCYDHIAIDKLAHESPKAVWVARKALEPWFKKFQIANICLDLMVDRPSGLKPAGSGSEAFLFAYALHHRIPSLVRIHYVGLDFTDSIEGGRYSVTLLPHALPRMSFVEGDLTVSNARFSVNPNYPKQLSTILGMVKGDMEFNRKLVCHSHFDLREGVNSAFDKGWRTAFRTTEQVRASYV